MDKTLWVRVSAPAYSIEPLNKVRRSNKSRRSRQRSWEKWSTLGEPSGKWDYYVKYDAPPDTTPIEEIAATGWGDEFSDDEVTPGKITILEEKSDWDDDERSGGKDEQLAIQKQELESEWENPLATKRGENHTILHLSKEEENDDLPYPKFRNFKQVAAQIIKKHEEHAFPSTSQEESTQNYQPPPAQQNPQPFYRLDYQFGYPKGKSKIFSGGYGKYYNSQWTLPPAWTESGVMLVLPTDPGLWSEVISRWESITINRLNNQTWSDAALAKELRDLSLCSSIPIPGYYKNNRKKYRMRKSRTYKGKPHNSHVKPFKRKYKDDRGRVKKCKCFICGKERHFAKDCRSKQGNIARPAVYQELDFDDNWDIVSADFDDCSVYSISEGEGDTHQSISVMV
ncbi:Orf y [Tanacetum coccineum]